MITFRSDLEHARMTISTKVHTPLHISGNEPESERESISILRHENVPSAACGVKQQSFACIRPLSATIPTTFFFHLILTHIPSSSPVLFSPKYPPPLPPHSRINRKIPAHPVAPTSSAAAAPPAPSSGGGASLHVRVDGPHDGLTIDTPGDDEGELL